MHIDRSLQGWRLRLSGKASHDTSDGLLTTGFAWSHVGVGLVEFRGLFSPWSCRRAQGLLQPLELGGELTSWREEPLELRSPLSVMLDCTWLTARTQLENS